MQGPTELARPQTSASRVSTATSSLKAEELAAEAKINYFKSKKAYADMMAKTRVQTKFAGEPTRDEPEKTITPEEFASQAKSNFISSKQAYIDMKDRQ